jgi:hypothetical protein
MNCRNCVFWWRGSDPKTWSRIGGETVGLCDSKRFIHDRLRPYIGGASLVVVRGVNGSEFKPPRGLTVAPLTHAEFGCVGFEAKSE